MSATATGRLAARSDRWLLAGAGGAGLALLLPLASGGPLAGARGAGAGGPAAAAWSESWAHWELMALAMMLPIALPYARRVAWRSAWPRRRRAPAAFLLGYAAVWSGLGAGVTAVLVLAGQARPAPWLPAAALLVAAGWQVSGPRRRALQRCGSPRPITPWGRGADRDCVVAGYAVGVRCAATCGPVMLAMALGHSTALMAGLLAVLLSERTRGPNAHRRAGRPREAVLLLAFALALGLVALP